MLRELEVRDLGIIEKVRLELPAGFIVLTGETGAGKSLVLTLAEFTAEPVGTAIVKPGVRMNWCSRSSTRAYLSPAARSAQP